MYMDNRPETNKILNINNKQQKKNVIFEENFGKQKIDVESYKKYNQYAYSDVLQGLTADKNNTKFYKNQKYINKIIKRPPNKWK